VSYRTIILPFAIHNDGARLLFSTAILWRTGVLHILELAKSLGEQELKTSFIRSLKPNTIRRHISSSKQILC